MPLDVMSLLASQLEGHAWAVGDKSASERHEDGHAVSIIFATIASTLLVVLFYIAGPLYSLLTRSLKTGARSQGHVSVAHPESWDDKTKPPAQDSAMAVDTATKPEGPTGDFEGDINVSNDLPTEQQLKRAAEHPVLDPEGKTHTFKSLSSPEDGSRVLVIFIRHFLCGICQEYIRTLGSSLTKDSLSALEQPTSIVIIGCGQPQLIPFYIQETDCPFPIYADPTRKLYDTLGMIRTLNLGPKKANYIQSSMFWTSVRGMVQGMKNGKNAFKSGNYWQVGGEFLFEDGDVTWCHRMRNTRDHTEIPELSQVLRHDDTKPALRPRWSSGLKRTLSHKGTKLQRSLSDRRRSWSRSSSRMGDRRSLGPDDLMKMVKEEEGVENGHINGKPLNGLAVPKGNSSNKGSSLGSKERVETVKEEENESSLPKDSAVTAEPALAANNESSLPKESAVTPEFVSTASNEPSLPKDSAVTPEPASAADKESSSTPNAETQPPDASSNSTEAAYEKINGDIDASTSSTITEAAQNDKSIQHGKPTEHLNGAAKESKPLENITAIN